MSINKKELNAEITSKLCNVLVNCQELIDDLEDMEEVNLFKNDLKNASKRLLEKLETQVNNVFGVGKKKLAQALRQGKSEEEISELVQEVKEEGREMVEIYDKAMKSRREYRELDFNERILVLRIIKDIRNDNVKFVGKELYYNIEGK